MDKEYKEFKRDFKKILKLDASLFSNDNLFLVTVLSVLLGFKQETENLFKKLIKRDKDEFAEFWYAIWCKKQKKIGVKIRSDKKSIQQVFFENEGSLYAQSEALVKSFRPIKDFDNMTEVNFYLGLLYLQNKEFEGAYSFFCAVADSENTYVSEYDIALFILNVFGQQKMQKLYKVLF